MSGDRIPGGTVAFLLSGREATTTAPTGNWPFWARFSLLNGGLAFYGLGLSLMIAADVGLAPWDAFHVGFARAVPALSIGGASILTGLGLLLVSFLLLRVPVGLGSLLNMLLIGAFIDLIRPHLSAPPGLLAWAQFLLGTLIVGLATGTYIASGFGAGPRDGFVLGITRRSRWQVKYVRTGVEVLVLACGWALGAKVGGGTILFAIAIGPAMSLGMRFYGLRR